MGDMGTPDGQPDMQMYGSPAAPTAAQVLAAAQLVNETDTSLKRYANVQAAFAAGYTYVLKTNGEEHLLYDGGNPGYQGLNPQDPSSLVYAINVPNHAPVLLGAMYIMGDDQQNGPQVGGGLTRWHSHLVTCVNGNQIVAGFGVQLRGGCNPAPWQDSYTAQMLHVWVFPYPAGTPSTSKPPAMNRAGPGPGARAISRSASCEPRNRRRVADIFSPATAPPSAMNRPTRSGDPRRTNVPPPCSPASATNKKAVTPVIAPPGSQNGRSTCHSPPRDTHRRTAAT